MEKELQKLQDQYQQWVDAKLALNMERGWPCKEQLQLSMPMLTVVGEGTDLCREVDYRGYAGTGGIEPLKILFAKVLEVLPQEIYIGGTMSTTIMYDVVNKAVLFGLDGHKAWKDEGKVKFICPSPGYEKHFKICQTFGIEMIPVSIDQNGPDMRAVEQLVAQDSLVKGIWCVPLYSNPTGSIYSDEVVDRLASMPTAAKDFRIFWDNAYCVHHLTEEHCRVKNIVRACEQAGNPNRVFEFTSTSKITFPGGGVGVCASSRGNIKWLTDLSLLQLKSGDKINQLRHALFLKDTDGICAHMKKHAEIIKPKFDLVDRILHEELDELNIAKWVNPKGGYFINLELLPHMASQVCELCKNAGIRITPAGSTFPYGNDPDDKFLRLAPTYPPLDELEQALRLLCLTIKLAYLKGGEA